MKSNDVTMTMDGRTCVNGIPLSPDDLKNLHTCMGKCITEEIDNSLIEGLGGIKNHDITPFMAWDNDTKSYIKATYKNDN